MLAASFSPFLSEAATGDTADGASDVDGKRLLRSRLILDGGFDALEAEPAILLGCFAADDDGGPSPPPPPRPPVMPSVELPLSIVERDSREAFLLPPLGGVCCCGVPSRPERESWDALSDSRPPGDADPPPSGSSDVSCPCVCVIHVVCVCVHARAKKK